MQGELHRKLVEESADIPTIIGSDGTITYVSSSVARTLGYDPEELLGEVGYEYQHPDDCDAVADAIELIQANPDETKTIETRFRHADGSWRWIEATLQNRFDDPDIDGILVNSRDISQRKRQERRYQELAKEYRTLLEAAEDNIFFLTVEPAGEFRFERLNSAYEEQIGLTTADVRGKTPTDVFGEELGSQLRGNYRRCVDTQEPISYEEEVPVETGARFWQTGLSPVVTNGEVTRIIGITRNITERVKRERQLQSQKEQLDEFASVVSHDLRNPLNVAQGRAELLADDCNSVHLVPLTESLDRMGEIIADTLTLAREGQVVSESKPIELVNLLGVCWKNVRTDGATLDIEDEVTIIGDRSRLQHVFENLFRNSVEHGSTDDRRAPRAGDSVEHGSTDSRPQADGSVEHGSTSSRSEAGDSEGSETPRTERDDVPQATGRSPVTDGEAIDSVEHGGPDVTVRVGRIGGHGIYVEDTGPGISADAREDVFDPGYSSTDGGTGFGLTIVKRITEAHGWQVAIVDGTDGGARFEFTDVGFAQ